MEAIATAELDANPPVIFGIIPGWIVAIVVSILGSFFTVGGFVLQKKAVQAPREDRPWPQVGGIVLSPQWMCGCLISAVLPLPGNVIAYALAPISLLAPLGGVSIIVNFVFAPLWLGEELQHRIDIPASLVILMGTLLTTTTGDHKDGSAKMNGTRIFYLSTQSVFLVAFTCLAVVVLGALACSLIFKRTIETTAAERVANPPVHQLLLPAILYTGFGCTTNLALKAASELLAAGISDNLLAITLVILIGIVPTGCLQLNYMNVGLRLYLQVIFFPIASALLMVTNVLVGSCLYQEYKAFEGAPARCVIFCAGIALTVAGINIFQFRKQQAHPMIGDVGLAAGPREDLGDVEIASGISMQNIPDLGEVLVPSSSPQ